MASKKYININFPFKNSPEGFFLDLTTTDNSAVKADLMHLILTRKGQRLYNPDFGTNLLLYIFEPNDNLTYGELKNEITTTVKKYLPNLNIDNLSVGPDEEGEYTAVIQVDYTINEGFFTAKDFIIVKI
jgi:phage baseplate assembly protein W